MTHRAQIALLAVVGAFICSISMHIRHRTHLAGLPGDFWIMLPVGIGVGLLLLALALLLRGDRSGRSTELG